MLQYLKEENNKTRTENGAATYCSTNSACLDFFACCGALRNADAHDIIARFANAFCENPDLAIKTLFYCRDIRGGLGERRVFRILIRHLAENHPATVIRNISFIAEYGRYDDLIILMDTPCQDAMLAVIRTQLESDLANAENGKAVSLLAKWLPSVNTSDDATVRKAKKLAKLLGMNDATYRKTLSFLRARIRILENNLREKDYSFSYEKQPSKAMLKYRKAFMRNDEERYRDFLARVRKGVSTLHTDTLTPYDVIEPIFKNRHQYANDEEMAEILETTWNALADFTNGENALVVADGSGSMYASFNHGAIPVAVAASLAIYFAERNTGAYKNHFITFSRSPRLVEIKGKDIWEKVNHCLQYNEVANTDLQKVFELILHTAVKNNLPACDLPTRLYIITDMEFDCCTANADLTNFAYAEKLFRKHGYLLPEIVFWNVSSRNSQQPVTKNEQGVALVSGCSPIVFSLLADSRLSPYDFMMRVLTSDRYIKIAA